ncbi:MFS transporter [Candidatus Micrarchaeota archaeon]|nr:MFS transporter [Candidatus Micrarchaeota archaeon]
MSTRKTQTAQQRLSVSEGNASALMQGFGTEFISPFALRLGASADQIGLLAALPQLVHALTQFLALHLVARVPSRLALIRIVVLIQAILWLPIAGLALWTGASAFWILLLLDVLITGASALVNPFWTSWLSEWVPASGRGAFFGMRNKLNGFTAVAAIFAGGLILSSFDTSGYAFVGFAVLFAGASLGRFASYYFFSRSKELPLNVCLDLHAGDAWKHAHSQPGFWLLVRYSAAFSFAVTLASPFFVIYLLNVKGFSYAAYAVTLTVAALSSFLAMPYWGKLADRYSNKLVLNYSSLVIPLVPVMYMAPVSELAYFALVEIVSGIVWAGQKLSSFNLLIENTPLTQRSRFVSYFNIANGFGTFGGALVGGTLAAYLLDADLYFMGFTGLALLFLLSAILRVACWLVLLPPVRGALVRQPDAPRQFFFKAVTILPFRSMYFVMQHDALGTAEMIGKGLHKLGRKEDHWLHTLEEREAHEVRRMVHVFRRHHRKLRRLLFEKRRH